MACGEVQDCQWNYERQINEEQVNVAVGTTTVKRGWNYTRRFADCGPFASSGKTKNILVNQH